MSDTRPMLTPRARARTPCLAATALRNRAVAEALRCQFRLFQCEDAIQGQASPLFCKVPLLAQLASNVSYDYVLFVDSDTQLRPQALTPTASLEALAETLFHPSLSLTTARLSLGGDVEYTAGSLHNASVITGMTQKCGHVRKCGNWSQQTNLHCTCIMLWRMKVQLHSSECSDDDSVCRIWE